MNDRQKLINNEYLNSESIAKDVLTLFDYKLLNELPFS